ncbi:MAG: four helix bundle protein [Barnesiella sp.]|nr:four helix bundle protein [Barnesiella sp.]
MMKSFLPPSGGYRNLKAYKYAEIIHDLKVIFVDKFIERGSRTRDQMVQAARSGKQNIAEGSMASMTSKETEIRLTNVAKASLEELKIDYEDFIRQHNLPLWGNNHQRTAKLKHYIENNDFINQPTKYIAQMNGEEFANMCITLIYKTTYMLARLLVKQQEQFLATGGIKEQMYRVRIQYRSSSHATVQDN